MLKNIEWVSSFKMLVLALVQAPPRELTPSIEEIPVSLTPVRFNPVGLKRLNIKQDHQLLYFVNKSLKKCLCMLMG